MSRRNDYDQQQILHIVRRLEHALSDIEYGSDNVGLSENEIDSLQKMLEAVKIEKHKKAEAERERKKRREEAEKRRREEEARAAQLAIEKHERHVQKVTAMELPMDWENFYASDETVLKNHTESIPDAYVKCLNQKGCVDIEYIAALSGSDCKTVIEKLKGSVYQNPETWGECFYKGFEPADQYLSGNIRKKLAIAKKADEEYHGYFKANVEALRAVMPPDICSDDIYATLGSPWIPADVIEQFFDHLIDKIRKIDHRYAWYSNPYFGGGGHSTLGFSYDPETCSWECTNPSHKEWLIDEVYGTKKRSAVDILLRTLNLKSVEVSQKVPAPNNAGSSNGKKGSKKDYITVIDKPATLEAQEKQRAMISEFEKWVWSDPERKNRLEKIYNEKFGGIKLRHYDGGFLELPGLNPAIGLYPYQKNAIARIIFSPNTLLAHEVGSGKTFIMIAAGMELKRMGLSKKNLYVVPNNIIGQWRNLFYELYPEADILCIEPKDFTPQSRKRVLREIQRGDYDAIIMPYSSFSSIGISRECRIKVLREEKERLDSMPGKKSERFKKKYDKISNELDDLCYEAHDPKENDEPCFDQLGVSRLFLDEAHNFKNVPIDSKIDKIMGINKTGSVKCKDMMDKVRIVQHDTGGSGVVFATGTPITNSITDAFIMQSYLQSGALRVMELHTFDAWVAMFAEKSLGFEIDVDTSQFRMATRFARFHNIPELTTMLAGVADFHQMDATSGIPEHDGYKDIVVNKTPPFREYLKVISARADAVRSRAVSREEDNMLLITTDGRKAALDMRLVQPQTPFTVASKVFNCADQVAQIYKATAEERSTQLVFCDTSTPKTGFNIYTELKGLLMKMGVAENEIAFVHDAATERSREKLFENMRLGVIRVLVGSTFKLGLGVNVQNKLIALHHLDVPWRPADMVQREGRILRQGNENKTVQIFRYITEGSFDAYSWQLLETKQRFITDILSGCSTERSGSDVDDTVLSYAEVKALAVGNPLIKERVEVANDLMKYLILQRKLDEKRQTQEAELPRLKERANVIKERLPLLAEDIKLLELDENKKDYTPEEKKTLRTTIYKASHSLDPVQADAVVAQYHGFDVIVPKNSSVIRPVAYLKHEGRYLVELGASDTGGMARIDNVLKGLPEEQKNLKNTLSELKEKIKFISQDLRSEENYHDKISEIRNRLERIDERLGVEK